VEAQLQGVLPKTLPTVVTAKPNQITWNTTLEVIVGVKGFVQDTLLLPRKCAFNVKFGSCGGNP
jgi:hypothetical protein